MCVLKVIYGMRYACALALGTIQTTFWPMSIGEESKPELGLKDIRRLMETKDRQLKLQGGA